MRILLLEDDPNFSVTLQEFLIENGYEVDLAQSFDEAVDLTFNNSYDLYLFDINLPKESGLGLALELVNAEDNTPIIFITALTDIDTIAKAFNIGAIDYIKKPFFPEELLIRLKHKLDKKKSIKYKNIELDIENSIVKLDNEIIDLGHNQYIVLKELLQNIGKPVSKDRLIELLDTPSDGGLRVVLNRLKKRLDLKIINIRSKGYMIEKI